VSTSSDLQRKRLHQEQWPELLELSIREVFQIMLGLELEPMNADLVTMPMECTAMVGLAGHMSGVITFRCNPRCATVIASRMLHSTIHNDDEQALDAIGEVCNMIAGNFKNKISGLSESCVVSAPTVVVGGDYRVHSPVAHTLQKAFQFDGSAISVALELRM
jgi:chemotaxis protein CheX